MSRLPTAGQLDHYVRRVAPADYAPAVDGTYTIIDCDHDGYRMRARHECGAVTVATIGIAELLGPDSVSGQIADRLFNSCYCVRREVLVPCTAQRCDGGRS